MTQENPQKSLGRKKAVAPSQTAKALAKQAEDKAAVLAKATDLLSSRVATLAGAVQTNNEKIDDLQREINQKPDDTELKFVEEQARKERRRQFKFAVATALSAAFISAYTAFDVANRHGAERCQINAKNIETLVGIIDRPGLRERYVEEIKDLRSNRNDCE